MNLLLFPSIAWNDTDLEAWNTMDGDDETFRQRTINCTKSIARSDCQLHRPAVSALYSNTGAICVSTCQAEGPVFQSILMRNSTHHFGPQSGRLPNGRRSGQAHLPIVAQRILEAVFAPGKSQPASKHTVDKRGRQLKDSPTAQGPVRYGP